MNGWYDIFHGGNNLCVANAVQSTLLANAALLDLAFRTESEIALRNIENRRRKNTEIYSRNKYEAAEPERNGVALIVLALTDQKGSVGMNSFQHFLGLVAIQISVEPTPGCR